MAEPSSWEYREVKVRRLERGRQRIPFFCPKEPLEAAAARRFVCCSKGSDFATPAGQDFHWIVAVEPGQAGAAGVIVASIQTQFWVFESDSAFLTHGWLEASDPTPLCLPSDAAEFLAEKVLEVTVVRRHGAAGKVACAWRTEDNTAKAGTHYTAGSGVLEFEHGQMVAKLPLTVLPAGRYQLSSTVRIVLSSITGGAKFDASTEGGRELCMATVVIQPDPAVQERILRIHSALAVNWTKAHTAKSNWTAWKEQILNAVKLTDDEEEEEEEEDGHEQSGPAEKRRGCMQYINMAMTAVLGVPWKIFFSVIPPPGFCDGWLCFFCSLGGIGLLTAVVGDLAALLGCVLDIGSAITAITLVALGTSLPDTFASRQAAVQDPTADASVGNVTGSNSVNVFLGLGMPWTLGALFWTIGGADATWNERFQDKDFIVGTSWTGGAFVVEAGGLAFSVMVFSCCAISCVILLAIRRRAFGGELGGPRCFAYLSSIFLVGLWAIYIGLSCWYVLTQ